MEMACAARWLLAAASSLGLAACATRSVNPPLAQVDTSSLYKLERET
jgi:hypothetical protein